jgi:hypothetical protein
MCACSPKRSTPPDNVFGTRWRHVGAPLSYCSCERNSKHMAIVAPGCSVVGADRLLQSWRSAWDAVGSLTEPLHCGLAGCTHAFDTLGEWDAHVASSHAHTCATCKAAFISDFLLGLHVQEAHDALFQEMALRQKMVGGRGRCPRVGRARKARVMAALTSDWPNRSMLVPCFHMPGPDCSIDVWCQHAAATFPRPPSASCTWWTRTNTRGASGSGSRGDGACAHELVELQRGSPGLRVA